MRPCRARSTPFRCCVGTRPRIRSSRRRTGARSARSSGSRPGCRRIPSSRSRATCDPRMPKVPRTPPSDRLDALSPDVHVLPAGTTVWRIYVWRTQEQRIDWFELTDGEYRRRPRGIAEWPRLRRTPPVHRRAGRAALNHAHLGAREPARTLMRHRRVQNDPAGSCARRLCRAPTSPLLRTDPRTTRPRGPQPRPNGTMMPKCMGSSGEDGTTRG